MSEASQFLEIGATVRSRIDPSQEGLVSEIQNDVAPPSLKWYVVEIWSGQAAHGFRSEDGS